MIPDLIYDVGMNNGDDTAYYLNRGFRVVAVEAEPSIVSRANERFREEITAGRLKILNIAVAQKAGVLPFWVCETHSEWNSFNREIASRDGSPHHQIEVECRPFQSILAEFGVPYYLKIDIEGNDHLCIEALEIADLPKYISVEKSRKIVSFLPRFRELGYTGFKCISQFNFLPLELPPSKEQQHYEKMSRLLRSRNIGIRILRRLGAGKWFLHQLTRTQRVKGWSFPSGSSGPFGEETPGSWQTFEDIIEVYNYYEKCFQERKPSVFWNNQNYSFWVDFHVRREANT
jgi:FkbM family methyltransferase